MFKKFLFIISFLIAEFFIVHGLYLLSIPDWAWLIFFIIVFILDCIAIEFTKKDEFFK